MMTVGVVGIGRMGTAMARALARAGHRLVLFNRTVAAADTLAGELGATVAPSPAEVAASAEVTITMLADDGAVRAVYAGPAGLLEGVRRGSVLVDMSTVLPDTITALGPGAREAGAGILDSPVSGSVALAEAGQLTLMVGGEAEDLERARPALEPLSKAIFHMGPAGSGCAMKLAVNTVIFGLNEALAEALVLAEAAGIDRALAHEVIATGAAGAPYVAYKKAAFLEPESTPVAFSLDLTAKDMHLIATLARSVDVSMPQAEVNATVVREASTGGRGSNDFSTVASELRSRRHARAAAGG